MAWGWVSDPRLWTVNLVFLRRREQLREIYVTSCCERTIVIYAIDFDAGKISSIQGKSLMIFSFSLSLSICLTRESAVGKSLATPHQVVNSFETKSHTSVFFRFPGHSCASASTVFRRVFGRFSQTHYKYIYLVESGNIKRVINSFVAQ